MAHKKDLHGMAHHSPEYVLTHGEMRLKKGKKLSATFGNIRNPIKAFAAAREALKTKRSDESKMRARRSMFITGQTPLEAFLGIPNPQEPPWPGARKVPHTTSQWY